MLSREEAIRYYERLLVDQANLTEELARIRDKIELAKQDLERLEREKEVYAVFQIDHQKALEEIEQKKNGALAEIEREKDNTSRVLKKQIEDADQQSAKADKRAKEVSITERLQHQQRIALEEREEKVAQREATAEDRLNQAKVISDDNKRSGEELSVAKGRLKQEQDKVEQDRLDNQAKDSDNADVNRQIQQEYSSLRTKQGILSQREATVSKTEEANKKRTEELDNREAELDGRESRIEAGDEELAKRKKNLDDKQKNLDGEKDDLAFIRAQLNKAIKDAKKKGIGA